MVTYRRFSLSTLSPAKAGVDGLTLFDLATFRLIRACFSFLPAAGTLIACSSYCAPYPWPTRALIIARRKNQFHYEQLFIELLQTKAKGHLHYSTRVSGSL